MTVMALLGLMGGSVGVTSPVSAARSLQGDGLRVDYHDETGKVSFIGADSDSPFQLSGISMEGLGVKDRSILYLEHFAELLGLSRPTQELQVTDAAGGGAGERSSVRYQQMYQGVPILAGELIVNTDPQGGLLSINGEISPGLSLSTKPTLSAAAARTIAQGAVAKGYGIDAEKLDVTEPALWVYDARLLLPSERPAELVWRMSVRATDGQPIDELVLVNAQSGGVSLHFNQIDASWSDFGITSQGGTHEVSDESSIPSSDDRMYESSRSQITSVRGLRETRSEGHPSNSNHMMANTANAVSGQETIGDIRATLSSGTTWYVSTSGDDSNDCLSTTTECASINGALGKAGFLAGDTIKVAGGTYTGSGIEVVLINKDAILSGGWNSGFTSQTEVTIIDGEGARRGVSVSSGISADLEQFTIENGASFQGAGILNNGTLILRTSEVRLNSGTYGGGIRNSDAKTTTIIDSNISENEAQDDGGGIYNTGTLHVINSTVHDNHVYEEGGGIFNGWGDTTTIDNSTIHENSANQGGGVYNQSPGTVTLKNTIIAGNSASPGPDCRGTISSSDYNLIESVSDCTFTPSTGDVTGSDPLLGYAVGHPAYIPLSASSPAVNAGNPGGCTDYLSNPLSTDQRGASRVGNCDIGAYEYTTPGSPASVIAIEGTPQSAPPSQPFRKRLKAMVLDGVGSPVNGTTVTYTAPSSGASGIFEDSATYTTTATSDAYGIATAALFEANASTGSYTVDATVSGVGSPAPFQLSNMAWYVSTTGSDSNDCLSPASACASINGAVNKAGSTTTDTILVEAGTFTGSGGEVVLLDKDVVLLGGWNTGFTSQDGTSIIDAELARRGVKVVLGVEAYIERFTVMNGDTTNNGDGIYNEGILTLEEIVVKENKTTKTGSGGGIFNEDFAKLYLNNSAVIDNGGLNMCTGSGVYNQGLFIATNSTISGNNSNPIHCAAAAVLSHGDAILKNTTVSYNHDTGIYRGAGSAYFILQNSLIANNALDCSSSSLDFDSNGYNLVGTADCTINSTTGDLIGTSASPVTAYLRPLEDNGGPTPTHALSILSPALDAGNPASPGSGGNACEALDQRGVSRPKDWDGDSTSVCDIGAYEYDPSAPPPALSVWYVTPGGSDSKKCHTPTKACKSINGVLAKEGVIDGDTIKVAAGTYTGSVSPIATIDKSVFIKGGWDPLFTSQTGISIIDCEEVNKAVFVAKGVTVEMDYFSIMDGTYSVVNNEGKLQFNYGSVEGSSSTAIYNQGNLTLKFSSVTNNLQGIISGHILTVNSSTVSRNFRTTGGAGGLSLSGTSSITNSTISDNTAEYCAGIQNAGTLTMNNSTVTRNWAMSGDGGGICNSDDVTLKNTMVASNTALNGPDCTGSITSAGYNLIGDNSGCTYSASTGDIVGTGASPEDPLVSMLGDNGGPTWTVGLLPASPAIDAGDPGAGSCEEEDQRGVARPIDGDTNGSSLCDIGAYELDPASPPLTPPAYGGLRKTYDGEHSWVLPGTLLCAGSLFDCTGGSDAHADAAHHYAGDTYAFYRTYHDRDSIDDAGMPIVSSVHHEVNYANAFWSTVDQQMVYGDAYGFPMADDVVAHELTHGVTEHESNLFYYYQSGAINESFSDMWGEFVDLTNGDGDDRKKVKWLIGEDITGLGAIRDMENPPAFGHPDKMTSPKYYSGGADQGRYGDYGGVHINSGVNNKAAYLLTDGGVFNGYKIAKLGIYKVASIYYEAQTSLLSSGADYKDLYNALYQACMNIVGGADGITYPDCAEVRKAIDAVEMNLDPITNYNPEATLCPEGKFPVDLFYANFEGGTGKWTFKAQKGSSAWKKITGYATSGTGLLWGDDAYSNSDSYAMMKPFIALPTGSRPYLHFNHSFGFEWPDYDGGWLEYKRSGSSSWVDARPLFMDGLDYTGRINTIFGNGNNRHTGRRAFIGDSHGYVSSKYNLTSLAGKSVKFRWRMSTDSIYHDWGWFLDDVRIYTCAAGPFLTMEGNTIDDDNIGDSSGNGDGKVDCGETIELTADLMNRGTKKATVVSAELSTSDGYITPAPFSVSSSYPNIPVSETKQNLTSYVFTVDGSTPYGYIIPFDLDVTASNGGPWVYPFGVFVSCGSAPVPNDDFDDAVEISSLPYSNVQDTSGATSEVDDPSLSCATSQKYNTVWYKYTPVASGILTVDTFSSDYDTVLGVWTGSRGSLKPVVGGCNDDSGGPQSKVKLGVAAGTTFYIEVAGHASKPAGSLEISASFASNAATLIKNASFEKDSNKDGIPNSWKGTKITSADGRVCTEARHGSCSFSMVGNGKSKQLSQTVVMGGLAGESFTLSGWSKASQASGAGKYIVKVIVKHLDGTTMVKQVSFSGGTHAWQSKQVGFTTNKPYTRMIVSIMYAKSQGTVWFDKVRLVNN
jgi:Zn-dependent metalloprotease